jgi:hypothetical protein
MIDLHLDTEMHIACSRKSKPADGRRFPRMIVRSMPEMREPLSIKVVA